MIPTRSMARMAVIAGAAVSMAALTVSPPITHQREPEPAPSDEKVSRQHKRWLERQARKQLRRHRKR